MVPAAREDAAERVRLSPPFERINVVGTSGSGKTRFARELAAALKLPYYEMDALSWKPGWQESPDDEFFAKVREVTSGPRWVLDGNYTRTLEIKWKNVQQVIWLDASFARTVWRVTARTIRRAFTREELWPGTGNRAKYPRLMAAPEYAHISFVRLRSDAEAQRFLETA